MPGCEAGVADDLGEIVVDEWRMNRAAVEQQGPRGDCENPDPAGQSLGPVCRGSRLGFHGVLLGHTVMIFVRVVKRRTQGISTFSAWEKRRKCHPDRSPERVEWAKWRDLLLCHAGTGFR